METKIKKGPIYKGRNKKNIVLRKDRHPQRLTVANTENIINKQIRDIAKGYLRPVVSPENKISKNIDDSSPDIEQVSYGIVHNYSPAEIENALFVKYKNYNQYLENLTKLIVFLNPYHYIGQFAKLFQEKAIQRVYEPSRLVSLDITDMLPEIFLNPKLDEAKKVDMYQQISIELKKIQETLYLDPMTSRKQKPNLAENEQRVTKSINKHKVDVKDLCENPYWTMKRVNMIICKESGKFYCLDIEKLLVELALTGSVKNYLTNNPLPDDIKTNLLTRYSKEIDEIKTNKSTPDIGVRKSSEIIDLRKTLDSLIKFKEVFNSTKMQKAIDVFGLNSMNIEKYGGEKDLLKTIPPLILEKCYEWEDKLSNDDFVVKLNVWLLQNIRELNDIVEKSSIEIDYDTLIQNKSPINNKPPTIENRIVKSKILEPGSVSFRIYNNYMQRFETLSDTILNKLRQTQTRTKRAELNEQLKKTNSFIKQLRMKGRTIDGVISILEEAIQKYTNILSQQPIGIERLYPTQRLIIQKQMREVSQYIEKIQQEIQYLKSVKTNINTIERPKPAKTPDAIKTPNVIKHTEVKPVSQQPLIKKPIEEEPEDEVDDFLGSILRDRTDLKSHVDRDQFLYR